MELVFCVTEALIQAIIWYILTDIIIKRLIERVIDKYEWWERIKSRGQQASYWTNISLYPAHSTSGIILILAMINDSTQLLFHGLLIESGYEIFDLCKLWYNYHEDHGTFFIIFNVHHSCNISMIIYICCFMEKISMTTYILVISLNGFSPITGLIPMICSALNLTKSIHRLTWFILWNVTTFVFGICRFVIFFWAIKRIIIDEFIDQKSMLDLVFFIIYVLLMTVFNIFIFQILCKRYYSFVKEGICSKQVKEG